MASMIVPARWSGRSCSNPSRPLWNSHRRREESLLLTSTVVPFAHELSGSHCRTWDFHAERVERVCAYPATQYGARQIPVDSREICTIRVADEPMLALVCRSRLSSLAYRDDFLRSSTPAVSIEMQLTSCAPVACPTAFFHIEQ